MPHSTPAPQHERAPQAEHDRATEELDAAVKASQRSALKEAEQRERRAQEEEQRLLALSATEDEQRRRHQEEEEQALQQAIAASEKEEREVQERRQRQQEEEDRQAQIFLEESRQSALREDEERVKREHAEILARSKREAEEEEMRRLQAKEEAKRMEEAAIQESLREMQDEWQRREEADNAANEFIKQGGMHGTASYWQHLQHEKAYDLAVAMEAQLSLGDLAAAGPSRATGRRPLPQTPVVAAREAGVERSQQHRSEAVRGQNAIEEEWEPTDDDSQGDANEADADDDPFTDNAEAPPTYDEVRVDRPPEAPISIPDHIRFAPPAGVTASGSSETVYISARREEKTAAYAEGRSSTAERSLPTINEATTSRDSLNSVQPMRREDTRSSHTSTRSQGSPAASSQSGVPLSLTPSTSNQTQSTLPTPPTTEQEHSTGDSPQVPGAEYLQRAMKATGFGYCSEPFSPNVSSLGSYADGRFPNTIQLRAPPLDGTLYQEKAFFVIRAPSWKSLLRAMAWYGNTRIEAGPEEVVDSPQGLSLLVDIEFVTPVKADLSKPRAAQASVCFSLMQRSTSTHPVMEPYHYALKNASRALDASYVRQGSTRRVISLPRQAPKLPIEMVRLAQHMHAAHTFSAACPSTGSTALHSPRDLHHAVEKHDIGYVAKVQRLRYSSAATGAASGSSVFPSARAVMASAKRNSGIGSFAPHRSGSADADARDDGRNLRLGALVEQRNGDDEYDDDADADDDEDADGPDDLDAGAVQIVAGPEGEHGRISRMRARVRRRLAKRAGDPRIADEDLESWISTCSERGARGAVRSALDADCVSSLRPCSAI